MTHKQAQPRSFRADLAGATGEATITLGTPPTLAFARPPFGFTRPLTREELGALAAGRFAADLDAQLRACAPPPIPPLDDADRARLARLAGEAWIALTVDGPVGRDPEPPASREPTTGSTNQAGLWPAPVPVPVPASPPPPDSPAAATSGDTVAAVPDCVPPGAAIAPREDTAPGEDEARIGGATAASPAEVAALPAPPTSRRALKVTLTLTPDGEDDYRALVGVGADGCDPLSRAIEGARTLATILAAVPAVVAAAEDRWLEAPRYPASGATGGAATAKAAPVSKTGAKKPARSAPAAPATPATPAAPAPAARRQIELFG